MNKIYDKLSNVRIIDKSYSVKFLFVAIIGIYVPLIALAIYIFSRPGAHSILTIILTVTGITILAIYGTLFILNKLIEPLQICKASLEDYLEDRTVPELPVHYKDEAGILMNKVQETLQSLDTLLEEKKDLIGLLSHDLRTPLSGILLLSSGMERTATMTDEQRKQMAGMISSSARDQIGLFQRILEILQNDDINISHLQLKQIKVESLVNRSMEQMALMAKQKELNITVNIEADCSILADEKLISQVLKNLINNAIKFSHPKSDILITVNKMNDSVLISVKDQGLGFNPEDAAELFKRYTSKRKSGTANEISTGMGLYLSTKIIKAHNGALIASSAGHNQGATFTVAM